MYKIKTIKNDEKRQEQALRWLRIDAYRDTVDDTISLLLSLEPNESKDAKILSLIRELDNMKKFLTELLEAEMEKIGEE